MNNKYVLGLDFSTLSGRALLVRVSDGKEVASAVHHYASGVITGHLPNCTPPGISALLLTQRAISLSVMMPSSIDSSTYRTKMSIPPEWHLKK